MGKIWADTGKLLIELYKMLEAACAILSSLRSSQRKLDSCIGMRNLTGSPMFLDFQREFLGTLVFRPLIKGNGHPGYEVAAWVGWPLMKEVMQIFVHIFRLFVLILFTLAHPSLISTACRICGSVVCPF